MAMRVPMETVWSSPWAGRDRDRDKGQRLGAEENKQEAVADKTKRGVLAHAPLRK